MPLITTTGGGSVRGLGRGRGTSKADWADLQSGDVYQDGIVVRTANTMAVQYYPPSRKFSGVSAQLAPLQRSF